MSLVTVVPLLLAEFSNESMSAKAKQTVLSKAAEVGIRKLQYDVFGTLPQLNVKTGFKAMKKMHKGVFAARYYPEPIEKSARLVSIHFI